MLNSVAIIGRLTKEPIARRNGETTIVNFDIAVDNIRKEADGTRGTTFLQVVCFNNIGENVVKHLSKGSKIALTGAIQQRNFIRQDGSKGSAYEIIADSVEFLDPKSEEPKEPNLEEIPPFDDGAMDSCGSLDGEKYEDEKGEEKELKFDPYTGKPLKATAKK